MDLASNDSFYDGVDPLNSASSITLLSIDLGLLLLFWVCTVSRVRSSDFVRNYIGSVMLPISISVVIQLFRAILTATGFRKNGLVFVLHTVDIYFYTVGSYTFVVGSVAFLIMTVYAAYKRKQIPVNHRMRPYVIILLVSAVVEVMHVALKSDAVGSSVLLEAVNSIISVFSVTIWIVFCCCSDPMPEQDNSDPVVYNARSRMGWAFAFKCLSDISLYIVVCISEYSLKKTRSDMEEPVDNVGQIEEVMAPLVMLLAVFLCLPTYRTALFACGDSCDPPIPTVETRGEWGQPLPPINGYRPVYDE